MRHVAITLSTLLHMVYIQIPDGIYPRPVTNFLMISLLGGMGGGVPPTSKNLAPKDYQNEIWSNTSVR